MSNLPISVWVTWLFASWWLFVAVFDYVRPASKRYGNRRALYLALVVAGQLAFLGYAQLHALRPIIIVVLVGLGLSWFLWLWESSASGRAAQTRADLRKVQKLEARRQRDPQAIERVIQVYKRILVRLQHDEHPHFSAGIQNNLGVAYTQRLKGDRTANLNQAIACYQQALRLRTPEAAPLEYAATQNNLGAAYRNLLSGDRTANLNRAIECYQQALRFYTPEAAPSDYAMTQNNLGNAYIALPASDRAVYLERAIACFREALRFYTSETTQIKYALVQNSLGAAYSDLPMGDPAVNLAQAITCYQEAIRFLPPEAAPFEYAQVQTNLGNAYGIQGSSGDLPTHERTINLNLAITCYQQALRFYTPETAPLNYAQVQTNLGNAYGDLQMGSRTANAAQAIECYKQALRFYTPETEPFVCRTTNRNLAELHFAQREWKAALAAYRAALDAGEQIYLAGLSAESKAAEVAENAALYRHAAFSAARCGEVAEALLILERGKTRLLAEALRLRIPRPTNVPDEVWRAFEHTGAQIRALQSGSAATFGEPQDPVQAYSAREQTARATNAALDAAIEQVCVYAPAFLHKIDFPTIRALLPDERTVLVAFCITDQGSMGFVIYHGHDQGIQVIEVPNFTQTDLRRLLDDWLSNYHRFLKGPGQAAFDSWQATITRILGAVGQRLLVPILSTLPFSIERIIFLPAAELFLLPLHAAALSDTPTDRVCGRYQVSYAPSIEVLVDIKAKAVQRAVPELYAVINPTADLIFTPTERAAIAQLFPKHNVDEGHAGTKQRVIAGAQGWTYVHFSCHGRYNWNDPPASGLALANQSYLTLADLQRGEIDLSAARLVTLSACETGIIDVLQGSPEEYVGIPAGFMLVGVPCVVSSLWVVDDLSTALLMKRFYRNHLSGGMDFAAALCEAQVWISQATAREMALADLWKQIYQASGKTNKDAYRRMRYYRARPEDRSFAHPYYWAAFSVNGW